jgi:hypothetical protein
MVERSNPVFEHDNQKIAEGFQILPVVHDHQVTYKIDPTSCVSEVMAWLKCFLCGNVANPATICGTGSCGKIFCKPCIGNHVETDQNCPNPKSVH